MFTYTLPQSLLKALNLKLLATYFVSLNLPSLYSVHLFFALLSKLFVKYVYLIILLLILKHWDGCLLLPFNWILSKTYNMLHFLPLSFFLLISAHQFASSLLQ